MNEPKHQTLFAHMEEEHGLTLTDSELHEIELAAARRTLDPFVPTAAFVESIKAAKKSSAGRRALAQLGLNIAENVPEQPESPKEAAERAVAQTVADENPIDDRNLRD